LVELAAEGSWARIHRARPVESPRSRPAYAIKMLRPECAAQPEAIARLAREARAARGVAHPHLIAILEAHVSREPRYLVMPWLEGTTVEAQGAAGEAIDLPFALGIVRQAAEALEALDDAGWTHGDVKPSNLLVSPDGHVTLLDLGFAQHQEERGLARDRPLAGTGYYLAPEHCTPLYEPDIRSDIYSLGVVLYELLTGELPFQGSSMEALIVQHKQAAAPSVRRQVPQIPEAVARLVQAMLAKDPMRRPHPPRELIDELVKLEVATFTERAA
jgi:serine/threonine-protein kinase